MGVGAEHEKRDSEKLEEGILMSNDEKNASEFGGFKINSFLCSANQKECIPPHGKVPHG